MLIKPRYPKLQRQLPVGNNCIGAWLFHEGAGNTINDMTGFGNVGVPVGSTTWVAGAAGPALDFDGTTTCVNVPRFNRTLASITFIVLMKWYGSGAMAGIMFSRGAAVNGMNVTSTGKLGYHWINDFWDWESGPSMIVGSWCVYALSVFPTKAVAYVGNSAGITSATNTNTHLPATIDVLQIGSDAAFGEDRFNDAEIGGAMIFDKALIDSEIRPFLNQDFFRLFRQPQRTRGLMELISVPGPALHVVQSGMRW